MADYICGVCDRPADLIVTVPMCGDRPRFPMCMDCWIPLEAAGYAEEVSMVTVGTEP